MVNSESRSLVSRRRLMQAGSAMAAGSLLGCGGGEQQKTAIVIGSGFAGSVAALRLAQAGIPTTLLERGMHWPSAGTDSFPRVGGGNDGRTTWLGTVTGLSGAGSVPRYTGLIERVFGDTLDAVCAAGVGGGSLVYGGVLLQPMRALFEQVLPDIDYDEMDAIYYPRVLAKVSGGPIPDDILAEPQYRSQAEFIQVATAAGMSIKRANVGFDWSVIRAEMQGTLPAAASVGEYIYGCNSGAKKSLDKNYLAEAQGTGLVTLKAQHQVSRIRKRLDGMFEVHGNRIDTQGQSVSQFVEVATHVFMAAGSLNTTKLMLKCKAAGDLPALNEWVGQNWGGNGDQLTIRFAQQTVSGSQGGPASIAATDLSNSIKPVAFMHSPTTQLTTVPLNMQIQLGMCVPDALGSISYDASTDSARVQWPAAANAAALSARQESLQKLITASGGSAYPGAVTTSVWHPLGGMTMGKACTQLGEVYGYDGLFVIDGSLIPGSTGCANPALTVAANAERIMDKLLRRLA